MFCMKCGNPLQEGDKVCAQCGQPVGESKKTDEGVQFELPEEMLQGDFTQNPESMTAVPVTVEASGRKKSGKKLVFAVVAVLVVLLAGVGIAKGAEIANAVRQSTMSPAEYYQYVEEQAVKDIAAGMADSYDKYIKSYLDYSCGTTEIKLGLGELVTDMLEAACGIDFAWLNEIGGRSETYADDDLYCTGVTLFIGKEDVANLDIMFDQEKSMVYLYAPELNEKYIAMDMEELYRESLGIDTISFKQVLEDTIAAYENMPDEETIEKLVEKYLTLAISCVKEVEKEKDTLQAGDVSVNCTLLTVTIDEDVLRDIAEAVLKEAVKDKDLKKVFLQLCEANGEEDGEQSYQEFVNTMESMLDEIDDIRMKEEMEMKVWVDAKGTVCGRALKGKVDYNEYELFYAFPEDGKELGIEVVFETNDLEMELSGSGKQKNGKWNGSADLNVSGIKVAEVTFENVENEDRLNGTFTLTPGKLVREVMEESSLESGDFAVKLELGGDKKEWDMTLTLMLEDETFAYLSLGYEKGEDRKITIPDAADTVTELEELDLSLDKVWEKMQDAGVPKELLEELQKVLEQ